MRKKAFLGVEGGMDRGGKKTGFGPKMHYPRGQEKVYAERVSD